jgi:hypothetical protein
MANFIIVYSTENNRPWQPANWSTATEKSTLDAARKVFENYVALAEQKATDYDCRPNRKPITQVAVFVLRGGETFRNKPRLYFDNRDKSDWPISEGVSGLVNSVNSDFTINR